MDAKNYHLATAGNACTIIGCCLSLASLVTPITGDWNYGLAQLIGGVIMMTLAINAFQGMRCRSPFEETKQEDNLL